MQNKNENIMTGSEQSFEDLVNTVSRSASIAGTDLKTAFEDRPSRLCVYDHGYKSALSANSAGLAIMAAGAFMALGTAFLTGGIPVISGMVFIAGAMLTDASFDSMQKTTRRLEDDISKNSPRILPAPQAEIVKKGFPS